MHINSNDDVIIILGYKPLKGSTNKCEMGKWKNSISSFACIGEKKHFDKLCLQLGIPSKMKLLT